jgi:TATA-box binding protein (TBP) (component of TFIID and TFIIIB)
MQAPHEEGESDDDNPMTRALCKARSKLLRTCGFEIPLTCINAQCTFSLGDIQIDLVQFMADNPHIPGKLNLDSFAAAFITVSRTVAQQREYMSKFVDPFDVRPENSQWLRDANSNATVLLFSHGKVVVTGAKDGASAMLAAYEFCRLLNDTTALTVQMCDFTTCNQVVCFSVPFPINLAGLKATPEITSHVQYKPEKFPLAAVRCSEGQQPPKIGYKSARLPRIAQQALAAEVLDDVVPTSRRAALVSPSGQVIVTGAQDLRDAEQYMRRIFPFLLLHRDSGETTRALTQLGGMTTTDVAEVFSGLVWRTTYGEESRYGDQSDMVKLGKRVRDTESTEKTEDPRLLTAAAQEAADEHEVSELFQHIIRETYGTEDDASRPLKQQKKQQLKSAAIEAMCSPLLPPCE